MYNSENYNPPTEWDFKYISMADYIGSMSKCAAKKVGCLIVKGGTSIISSGVNGTPSGYTNCNRVFHKHENEWYSAFATDKSKSVIHSDIKMYLVGKDDLTHKEFSERNEIHAEINAISKAAKTGISTEGSTLYCNYSPCIHCAKSIIAAGIEQVYYLYEFDDQPLVEKYLKDNNIHVGQLINMY